MATIVGYTSVQYSGVWTMQQVDAAKAAGTWPTQPVGFIETLTSSGSFTELGYAVTVDSSGNIYVCGGSAASGTTHIWLAKFNSSGAVQWQNFLASAATDTAQNITLDSSGNIYIVGLTYASGTLDLFVAKYNNSGAVQWQRRLGSSYQEAGTGIVVDVSGNVYVSGYGDGASGNNDFVLVKYNSSGTLQWQKKFGNSNNTVGNGLAIDSSGNLYLAGNTNGGGATSQDCLIAKYDSSGTLLWQRILGTTGSQIAQAIAVDSSGNSYITGYVDNAGTGGVSVITAKYNTSGTLQWQRTLSGLGTDYGYSIAVDGSGNSYVTGSASSVGTGTTLYIAKYDTSGTLQWQRIMDTSSNDQSRGIAVDSLGSMYITGFSNNGGNFDVLLLKLPSDGSATGTYGVWTYSASSLTSATSTYTSSTSSLTDSTSTLTDAATTLTASTASLTSTLVLV